MPKRKRSREDEIERYKSKIKGLQRKIRDRESVSASEADPTEAPVPFEEDIDAGTPALRPDDWLLDWPEEVTDANRAQTAPESQPDPRAPSEVPLQSNSTDINPRNLDTEILEILGDDPTCSEKFGPEIHNELANRLLYIGKEGLAKEIRKTLLSKYILPSNCAQLDAPKINLEIKAAITDTAFKRDKGIETKQKQMTVAIACLSEIINGQINSPTKNNKMLQKLMDVNKILCDIQHADSVTRRNFILFALKSDFKEHLKNTKIDSYLFGENLSETLKSAKAVNKSGGEMKIDVNKTTTKFRGALPRPLSRKAPPQARRPLVGATPPAPRSREPVLARGPYHPPAHPVHQASHAQSSKTSPQTQYTTYPRRRY